MTIRDLNGLEVATRFIMWITQNMRTNPDERCSPEFHPGPMVYVNDLLKGVLEDSGLMTFDEIAEITSRMPHEDS